MDERGGPYWMYGAQHAHHEWWAGPLHALVVLAVVALLVVGAVWLVRRLMEGPPTTAVAAPGGGGSTQVSDPAVAELRLRYARGEIERDAYLQSFADLTGRAEAWPGQVPPEAPTAVPPAPA
jgi:uncharacterized membrane protein